MAMKRCPDCGEKYSDSYKYCPFCEEEEILKEGKGRGSRRARQSKGFSVLTPVLIVLIIVMAGRQAADGTGDAPARRGDTGQHCESRQHGGAGSHHGPRCDPRRAGYGAC